MLTLEDTVYEKKEFLQFLDEASEVPNVVSDFRQSTGENECAQFNVDKYLTREKKSSP